MHDFTKGREEKYNTIETKERPQEYRRRERNLTEGRKRRKRKMKSKSKSRKRLNNEYTQISNEMQSDFHLHRNKSGRNIKKEIRYNDLSSVSRRNKGETATSTSK